MRPLLPPAELLPLFLRVSWKELREWGRDTSERGRSMAITVNLRCTGKDGSAKKFAEEMERSGTAQAIRREPGNLRYEYWVSLADPETVLLIDSWKDQAAIDVHHASAMMKTIAELRDRYDLHMTFERYLSDDVGMPAEDRKFIRE